MILHGNQRSGGRQMALHLLNGDTNEHIEVYEVSGFISQDVQGALNEAYALSKGTKCRQFMYSASFNPPEDAEVSIETFENAINRTEKKLGLTGQPRIIVFHEKEGRRHAHCVWSRIDIEAMKAVNISHDRRKLKSLSKELFLENKWNLPKGFIDPKLKNPLNYTRAEWSQAQRTGQHPKTIKEALQDNWQVSDNRKAFKNALQERGYYLAQGDKKGVYVTVDLYGEVYPLARKIKVTKAELEKRLGKTDTLPSVTKAKETISGHLTEQFLAYHQEQQTRHKHELEPLVRARRAMTDKHRQARKEQKALHQERRQTEELKRTARLRKGFKGLWDKLTGTYQRTRARNEKETQAHHLRDRKEKEKLITTQLTERRKLQGQFKNMRQEHTVQRADLIKGMDKHYRKIDRQIEIRKLFEREKGHLRKTIKNNLNHEPEV